MRRVFDIAANDLLQLLRDRKIFLFLVIMPVLFTLLFGLHPNPRACAQQQSRVRRRADQSDAFAFFNLLTSPELLDRVESLRPEHRERLFPPTETLSMFLSQALSADRSCQRAVNEAAVRRLVGGLPRLSTHTGAYCRARSRLPLSMPASLVRHTGQRMSAYAAAWRWHGHPVRLVDGTTLSMPDTSENQAVYPQPRSQAAGLGFPLCRLVGLICLGSGAVLDAALGGYRGKGGDEQTLLRTFCGGRGRAANRPRIIRAPAGSHQQWQPVPRHGFHRRW